MSWIVPCPITAQQVPVVSRPVNLIPSISRSQVAWTFFDRSFCPRPSISLQLQRLQGIHTCKHYKYNLKDSESKYNMCYQNVIVLEIEGMLFLKNSDVIKLELVNLHWQCNRSPSFLLTLITLILLLTSSDTLCHRAVNLTITEVWQTLVKACLVFFFWLYSRWCYTQELSKDPAVARARRLKQWSLLRVFLGQIYESYTYSTLIQVKLVLEPPNFQWTSLFESIPIQSFQESSHCKVSLSSVWGGMVQHVCTIHSIHWVEGWQVDDVSQCYSVWICVHVE